MSTETESASGNMAALMMALPKVEKWKDNPSPHGDYNSVAISADGSKVVAGTFYYNDNVTQPPQTVGVYAWDGNGQQLMADTFSVTADQYRRGGVECVAISKDGAWIASGGSTSPGVGFIDVYDAAGTKTPLLQPLATVRAVALSSNGEYLVAGANRLYVFKRNGNAWGPAVTVANPVGTVRRVAISDDGQWIVTAIDNGWTSLVHNQLATGGGVSAVGSYQLVKANQNDPQPYVQHVAVAGDGSAYAAAGADGRTHYFDIAGFQSNNALKPRWAFNPPGKSVCRWVAISQDGSHVATIFSFDPNPQQPNTPTKGRTYFLENIPNPGPNGAKYQRLWTGNERTAHGPNAVSMGQTAASKYYVTVADGVPDQQNPDGGFYLFDGGNGNSMWGGPPDHNFPTTKMNYCVAMSADGTAIVGGSNDGYVYYFVVP
jgi:WD40 repeat protein